MPSVTVAVTVAVPAAEPMLTCPVEAFTVALLPLFEILYTTVPSPSLALVTVCVKLASPTCLLYCSVRKLMLSAALAMVTVVWAGGVSL